MEFVTLGRTGLRASVVGLGTGGHSRLGRRQGGSDAQAADVVRAALDRGVNFIDTAAGYDTEHIVREAVQGRRDKVILSTKVKHTVDEGWGTPSPITDGAEIKRRVDRGLQRLGMDCIDILHLHGVGAEEYGECRERLVPTLLELRAAGKIRFLGITEQFNVDNRHTMLERAMADGVWDIVMLGFNMVSQAARPRLLPELRRRGIGSLCMYAVRNALASPEAVKPLVERLIAKGEVDPAAVDAADPLGFVLKESDAGSLTEAAYRYCRHTPGMDVVLTGTGSVAHLDQNIRSITAGPLPQPVVERLNRIFGRAHSETGDPPGGFAATLRAAS